jgi:hypothetical protein
MISFAIELDSWRAGRQAILPDSRRLRPRFCMHWFRSLPFSQKNEEGVGYAIEKVNAAVTK